MPNVMGLENGNEAAVKHKRTCSTISVPNSPCSEAGVFKDTLRKVMSSVTVSVGWVWTDGYFEQKTSGEVQENKDASGRSVKFVKTILFAVFVLNN